MADVKTEIRLVPWPSPQDYNEAIQNLAENTQDSQLKAGQVQRTALGLPRSVTGAFASVYRVGCADAEYAVRCFLRDISDQDARYKLISEFVQSDTLPYTVSFNFMPTGIRVGRQWYPALKMDWVDGTNLDFFVEKNLGSSVISNLAESFKSMCAELRNAGIAHGDLQHGNIIVCGEELRLVDYDGMYVPSMAGMQANELGHRNYQHPLRTAAEFGPHLDNFSAWVIYASLRAVALDRTLWELLGAGDDCLLFRRDDFIDPEHSYSFAVLEHHPNEEIRALAKFLRWQCHCPVRDVPPLSDKVPAPPSFVGELTAVITKSRKSAPTFAPQAQPSVGEYAGKLPEWINGNSNVSAVVGARQRPKKPPSRVTGAIDPSLREDPPRHAVRKSKTKFPWTAAYHRILVEHGVAALTEKFEATEHDAGFGSKSFEVRYSFRSPRTTRLVEVCKTVSESDYNLVKDLTEATVLCDELEPHMRNDLYELMDYRAAKPIIPTGIEPELKPPRRRVKFREDRFDHLTLINLVLALPLVVSLMVLFALGATFAGIGILFWLSVAIYLWSRTGLSKELVAKGIPARATVQSVRELVDGSRMIEYTFVSVEGNISSAIEAKIADCPWHRGDVITVLYDINNPRRNVPYRLAQYVAE